MPPSSAYQPKSYPRILAQMIAGLKRAFSPAVYAEIGGVFVTLLELVAFVVAEIYVRTKLLVDLFSIWRCFGVDLDERARDFGSDHYDEMKRRPARTSIVPIIVTDGVLAAKSMLAADVLAGATAFAALPSEGQLFASGGSVVIEPGTAREEIVVFTRTGDAFSVVAVPGGGTGLLHAHAATATFSFIATRSYLATAVVTGALVATLATGTGAAWPSSGNVVVDRETGSIRELVTFTRSGDTLTLSTPLVHNHAQGATLVLSTAGVDRQVPLGTGVFAQASPTNKQVNFHTIADGVLYDGDLSTGLILAESDEVGYDTRVGSGTLVGWLDKPFATAVVSNPLAATRGRPEEEDDDYRERLWAFILSLSRSTPIAIETLIQGLEDPDTGQTVEFAQVVEPVAPGESILYINDGTASFALTFLKKSGREVLINDALTDDAFAKLGGAAPYQFLAQPAGSRSPRVYRSVVSASGLATSTGVNYIEDTAQSWTVNAYAGMQVKAVDGTFYTIVSNTAIRLVVSAGGATPPLGQYAVFDFTTPLVPGLRETDPGIDYVFNETTGDLELLVPLVAHEALAAADDGATSVGAYVYATGLGALVQRVVNGDRADKQLYPGIKASGTKVLTKAPVIVSPLFVIQIVPKPNFSVAALAPLVRQVTQAYVNSLGIGGEEVHAQLSALIIAIPGVKDVYILKPATNSRVAAGQLQRISAANTQVN